MEMWGKLALVFGSVALLIVFIFIWEVAVNWVFEKMGLQ